MSDVYKEILEWSTSQPLWQKDALRRMVVKDNLDPDDIDDLVRICKSSNGMLNDLDENSRGEPLRRRHVPVTSRNMDTVRLVEISDPVNVNALASNECLTFEREGITAIYGRNGSGKSGYTRVLKNICRARGNCEVHPNAFEKYQVSPNAQIELKNGMEDIAFQWTNGETESVPQCLSAVSVFDSYAADIYINKRTEAAYRPTGHDLLPRLTTICQKVRSKLQEERSLLEENLAPLPEFETGTPANKFLTQLSKRTDDATIHALCSFGSGQKQRLETLEKTIESLKSKNGKSRAEKLENQANRLTTFLERLTNIRKTLGKKSETDLQEKKARAKATGQLAIDAAKSEFKAEPVSGTGGPLWKILLDAAGAFFEEEVSSGESLAEASHCVLCQQKLTPTSKERLARFTTFLADYNEANAAKTDEEFKSALKCIKEQTIEHDQDAHLLEEIDRLSDSESIKNDLAQFLASATRRRKSLLAAANSEDWSVSPELPEVPLKSVRQIIQSLEERAKALRKPAVKEELAKCEKERRNLLEWKNLTAAKDCIKQHVKQLRQIASLDLCISECGTRSISNVSGRILEEFISQDMQDRFEDELEAFGHNTLPVKLEKFGVRKGELLHKIRFSSETDAQVNSIASEGEARAIALASFFAELATEDTQSAIIFDDPMSSLDHQHRRGVAQRLAKVSQERQVIVFSHDAAFILELNKAAEEAASSIGFRQLRSNGQQVGLCSDQPPWIGLTTKKRIGWLRQRLQKVGTLYRAGEIDRYETEVAGLYGKLREAWERGVEEVLLKRCVERLNLAIHTRLLREVWVTEQDYQELNNGMSKCSRWLSGHDESSNLGDPFPTPKEVREDIGALDAWRKRIEKRKRADRPSKNEFEAV